MDRMQAERFRPFPLKKHLSMILCDVGRLMPSMATLRTLAHSKWRQCGMQAAVAHCKRLHTLGYEGREAFANVDWRARALDGTAIEG